MRFYFIIFGLPVISLIWWCWADRQLIKLAVRPTWRLALGCFVIIQLIAYGWLTMSRFNSELHPGPAILIASAYIWNLLAVPLAGSIASAAIFFSLISSLRRRLKSHRAAPRPTALDTGERPLARSPDDLGDAPTTQPTLWTRRQILAASVVAIPPAFSIAATGRALYQVQSFRVRAIDVPIPNLPAALDGATIAHLSDIHVGRFTNGTVLRAIVDATNALRADLVLVTGDLIDYAISDLPTALDAVRKLDARSGVYCCEGNHDLFDDRNEFEQQSRAANIGMLLNESASTRVRGVDVQLLGLRWGSNLNVRNAGLEENIPGLFKQRHADVFPILLAHHPHAFDSAVQAGIPLTFAGHTHGGQLMLGNDIGPGPLMFKYWSGLYSQEASSLVVSNGTGNWFPLRTFAPAEIVHITLRQARTA